MSQFVFATRFGLAALQALFFNSSAIQTRLYQSVVACGVHSSSGNATTSNAPPKSPAKFWNRSHPRQYRGVENWQQVPSANGGASLSSANIVRPSMVPHTTVTDAIEVPKFAFISKVRLLARRSRSLLETGLISAALAPSASGPESGSPDKPRYTGDCTFCKGPNAIEGLHNGSGISTEAAAKKCASSKENCFLCCGKNRG